MSRKAREDKSNWKVPSIYAFVAGYGCFRPKSVEPIDDVLVVLNHPNHSGNSGTGGVDHPHDQIEREGYMDHYNYHQKHHRMYHMAGQVQQLLLVQKDGCQYCCPTILVVDLQPMFNNNKNHNKTGLDEDDDDYDDLKFQKALAMEDESVELTKGLGKKILRILQRLHLKNVTLAATGRLCNLAWKLMLMLQPSSSCHSIWLIHFDLSAKFVNAQLVSTTLSPSLPVAATNHRQKIKPLTKQQKGSTTATTTTTIQLHLVVENEMNKRVPMLRAVFPCGTLRVVPKTDCWLVSALLLHPDEETNPKQITTCNTCMHSGCGDDDGTRSSCYKYDPEYCDSLGRSLFCSQVTVEMNRHTKQYERNFIDITNDLTKTITTTTIGVKDEPPNHNFGNWDWAKCEQHIGALVLRGNRCVLVRSLEGVYTGMRIPSTTTITTTSTTTTNVDETPHQAAIRAVVETTGVDATQVQPLPNSILPATIYGPNGRNIILQVYPLYAVEPPPDGPLEDADMEDDESPYDWYLYENAIQRLDPASIAGLQILALTLIQAANVGLVPAKWGGVFGQELKLSLWNHHHHPEPVSSSTLPMTSHTTNVTSSSSAVSSSHGLLQAPIEEWQPSRQGDILQDVRKANEAIQQRLATRPQRKLPVTLLSGFLGSGKTTLLLHILANYYEGLKVAILVNDMGEINIDATILKKSNNTTIRQAQEHMVELSNGCICCTLREDLLVEVANIAASAEHFDYLIIESSGISEPMPVAETFTFADPTGLRLGDVAEIDTMVTVIDGSTFFRELDSLECLQERNWHADSNDQRTISHLLCDQVEFANVIVLNKCDLMQPVEKDQVKNLLQKMNPAAVIVESEYGRVPLDQVLGTGLFSMSEAERHEGWLHEARIGEHTPETEEYGIGSFTYRAIKPFHPRLLYEMLQRILERQAPFDQSIILRAKGFVWLANCLELQGEFSLAGNHYTLLPGNPWWAEIDKSNWPDDLERTIAPLWHEPYGDRQQEIVLIGQSLDQETIIKSFNDCLLSDEEFVKGPASWNRLCQLEGRDPFQKDWPKGHS